MGENENSEDSFVVDSVSPDQKWAVVFEDNGETGYLYLAIWRVGEGLDGLVDHLWIYNMISPPIQQCEEVYIIWNNESTRAGLIVDDECWGILDLASKRKMNAQRIENSISSIPRSYWENGLEVMDGEELRLVPQ